jgi:hypothetical protein
MTLSQGQGHGGQNTIFLCHAWTSKRLNRLCWNLVHRFGMVCTCYSQSFDDLEPRSRSRGGQYPIFLCHAWTSKRLNRLSWNLVHRFEVICTCYSRSLDDLEPRSRSRGVKTRFFFVTHERRNGLTDWVEMWYIHLGWYVLATAEVSMTFSQGQGHSGSNTTYLKFPPQTFAEPHRPLQWPQCQRIISRHCIHAWGPA